MTSHQIRAAFVRLQCNLLVERAADRFVWRIIQLCWSAQVIWPVLRPSDCGATERHGISVRAAPMLSLPTVTRNSRDTIGCSIGIGGG